MMAMFWNDNDDADYDDDDGDNTWPPLSSKTPRRAFDKDFIDDN